MTFPGNAHKHITTKHYITRTEKRKPDRKHTRHKHKPKIVRTVHYECAYVTVMAVLIIFPLIFQTVS